MLVTSSFERQTPDVSEIIDAVVWTQNDGGVTTTEINDFGDISPEVFGSVKVTTAALFDANAVADSDDVNAGGSIERFVLPGGGGFVDTNLAADFQVTP